MTTTLTESMLVSDEMFEGITMKAAKIAVDFDKTDQKNWPDVIGIGARRVEGEDEQQRGARFRAVFVGDRAESFRDGLGAHLQSLWDARCEAEFALRRTGRGNGTPDATAEFATIVVLGAFVRHNDAWNFFVAHWTWHDAEGRRHIDGRDVGSAIPAGEAYAHLPDPRLQDA